MIGEEREGCKEGEHKTAPFINVSHLCGLHEDERG